MVNAIPRDRLWILACLKGLKLISFGDVGGSVSRLERRVHLNFTIISTGAPTLKVDEKFDGRNPKINFPLFAIVRVDFNPRKKVNSLQSIRCSRNRNIRINVYLNPTATRTLGIRSQWFRRLRCLIRNLMEFLIECIIR